MQGLLKYFGHGLPGRDREGNPILLNLLGKLDVEGLFQSCQSKDYIKMHLFNVEMGLRLAARTSDQKTEEKILLVMDLFNLTTSHYSYKPFTNTFLTLVALFQENYPDIFKKIVLIRAPAVAKIAFNLLRPFLSEKTTAVVEMPGDEWKDVLFRYVDPEKWPAYWGGSLIEDGDEKCPSKVNFGIDVVSKEDYYDPSKDKDEYTEVTVYAGNVHTVEVDIKNEGTVLRWKYKTVMEDIGFSIYIEDSKTDPYDIVYPYIRLECSLIPVENEMSCDRKGKYILEFDNRYSWFSAKELSYVVYLQDAGD
ncbi:unnamed protein product [Soboliphyme baturini]|uniref:CRAL-TRIO domain-containing protein n=1 Tax=Soboliphyme baturini TaxID=241478 RepID=A0A3P8AHS3_9BILA|nr:unnamed protein product [Soboliphyme baturini]